MQNIFTTCCKLIRAYTQAARATGLVKAPCVTQWSMNAASMTCIGGRFVVLFYRPAKVISPIVGGSCQRPPVQQLPKRGIISAAMNFVQTGFHFRKIQRIFWVKSKLHLVSHNGRRVRIFSAYCISKSTRTWRQGEIIWWCIKLMRGLEQERINTWFSCLCRPQSSLQRKDKGESLPVLRTSAETLTRITLHCPTRSAKLNWRTMTKDTCCMQTSYVPHIT